MGGPAIHMAVELLCLVDVESFGVLDLTGCAVMVAVFAINGRIYFGKDEAFVLRYGVGRSPRRKEGFPFRYGGLQRHLVTLDGGA